MAANQSLAIITLIDRQTRIVVLMGGTLRLPPVPLLDRIAFVLSKCFENAVDRWSRGGRFNASDLQISVQLKVYRVLGIRTITPSPAKSWRRLREKTCYHLPLSPRSRFAFQ